MKTKHKWLIGMSGIVVVLAAMVYFFDWNLLRGVVERGVSEATGRSLTIGRFDVKLGRQPRVIVDKVTFANASWGSTPTMAHVQHAEITLDIPSLFTRQIIIPFVRLNGPDIVLEQNDNGVGNWVFTKNNAQPGTRTISLGKLDIDHGVLAYRSSLQKVDAHVELSSESDVKQGKRKLRVVAGGTYHGLKIRAQGEVGEITGIAELQRSYPIQLRGAIGNTRVRVQGAIGNLSRFEGINGDFELSGDSLAELFPVVGVPLPPTPAYAVSGHLARSGELWNIEHFKGHVGNSDVAGQFSVDRARQPQFIKATVQSKNLDLADLSGFIGARTQQVKTRATRIRQGVAG
jgi:uncharacterized protein involved in outer membrane biogenesis